MTPPRRGCSADWADPKAKARWFASPEEWGARRVRAGLPGGRARAQPRWPKGRPCASPHDTDLLLFGRVTYEGMAGYWPTPAARQDDPEVAELMNGVPKVVVSTTSWAVPA
jgi:hypothetical protein